MKKKFLKASSVLLAVSLLAPATTAFAGEYTVEKGDCLWKIAPNYNTNWQTLAEMNNLENPDLIFPGQVLVVPDLEKAQPSQPVVEEPAEPAVEEPAAEVPAEVITPSEPAESVEAPVEEAQLVSLGVADISMTGTKLEPDFSPDVTEYTVNVQDDIYGVKVTPVCDEGSTVTVDGNALNEDGTYVIPLSEEYESYGIDYSVDSVIKVDNGTSQKEYTIHIVRDNAADVYALFEERSYTDEETGLTLPYELYVPSDYDASKDYPVVFVLHGAGQRLQSLDMLLKRYQSATIWAKDSEAGVNQCIVVSPQITEEGGNGWTDFMIGYDNVGTPENPYAMQDWTVAAHNLLQQVKQEYSVDENRIYVTGLSMGGFGSFALAAEYPDEFAAVVAVCGGLDPAKAANLKDKVAVWFYHAKDDPAVSYDLYGATTLEALDEAGVEYNATIYEPGEVFYPSAHFAWTPAYADSEMRTWLFEQSK